MKIGWRSELAFIHSTETEKRPRMICLELPSIKEVVPYLYSRLLYKMGVYFLDIQYEQAGLGQSLVWYFSAFMTCKNGQFTFTLPVCKVVIREGIPRLELITLKYVTLSCKLFNFHVKCLFLSIFLSPGVERQKIQFFIGFRV